MSEGQRKLLGMGPSSRPAATPARRRAPPEPLVTPPSRAARPFLQPIVTGEEQQLGQLRTPGSKGSARNVTPDQLQRMMEELDDHVDAAAAQTATGAADFGAFAGTSGVQPGVSLLAGGNTYRCVLSSRREKLCSSLVPVLFNQYRKHVLTNNIFFSCSPFADLRQYLEELLLRLSVPMGVSISPSLLSESQSCAKWELAKTLWR